MFFGFYYSITWMFLQSALSKTLPICSSRKKKFKINELDIKYHNTNQHSLNKQVIFFGKIAGWWRFIRKMNWRKRTIELFTVLWKRWIRLDETEQLGAFSFHFKMKFGKYSFEILIWILMPYWVLRLLHQLLHSPIEPKLKSFQSKYGYYLRSDALRKS